MNALFMYELSRAARMYGVQVHAFVVMSNHIHLVVTDVLGVLPYFMHCLCLQVAKGGSALHGRWGGFWARGTYSRVELLDHAAMVRKIAYVHANPTSAGLVRRANRWPGLTSAKLSFEETIVVARPDQPFYAKSSKPLEIEFTLVPPPGVDPMSCHLEVAAAARQIEKESEAKMRKDNRRFVGEKRLLRLDPYDDASSWERRRGLDPSYASTDRRAREEAAQRSTDWCEAYIEARMRFAAGERDVEFPMGTWMMHDELGCRVAQLDVAA